MQKQDWVTVHVDSNPVIADIIKNALEAEGMQCVLENEMQAGEGGLSGLPVKVQVPAADAKRARQIIEKHERHHRAKS